MEDASVLINRFANLYASTQRYLDAGKVETTIHLAEDHSSTTVMRFKTYFSRPDRFLLKWTETTQSDDDDAEDIQQRAVWSNAEGVFKYRKSVTKTYSSLAAALSAALGTESSVSVFVPPLLSEDLTAKHWGSLKDLRNVRLEHRRNDLIKIVGTMQRCDIDVDLWLDKALTLRSLSYSQSLQSNQIDSLNQFGMFLASTNPDRSSHSFQTLMKIANSSKGAINSLSADCTVFFERVELDAFIPDSVYDSQNVVAPDW